MGNAFVRWARAAAAIAAVAALALPGAAHAQGKGKGGTGAAAQPAQSLDFELINVNNVLTLITNNGSIGNDPRTGNGFGFFPGNSPNNYIFNIGLWVGGIVNGTKSTITFGTDFRSGDESEPGRAAALGGGAEEVLCSDNAADLARWYPEFADAAGVPIVFSQKDCVTIYNDAGQGFAEVDEPIGLQVNQRTLAFTFGALSQVVFTIWDVVNYGTNTVDSTYIAVAADMDIGATFLDDRCSAVPAVPPGANNGGSDTVQTNLGICWDSDFFESSFDPNPPGFVGITFFQGPISGADTLGLTSFTLTTNQAGRPAQDPTSDLEQWQVMAGVNPRTPFIDATATDVRFVESSGPFTLEPGTTQRIVAGILFGNVPDGTSSLNVSSSRCFPQGQPCFLPDPNDPTLSEVINVQRAAQVIFDAGFLAPAPPPSRTSP